MIRTAKYTKHERKGSVLIEVSLHAHLEKKQQETNRSWQFGKTFSSALVNSAMLTSVAASLFCQGWDMAGGVRAWRWRHVMWRDIARPCPHAAVNSAGAVCVLCAPPVPN